jgi:molybdopterin converting factor small subunit
MPTLKIPTPLRPYAEGQSALTLPGEIVEEVLEGAVQAYPMLKNHLFNEEGNLRPYVNLFLGDENVKQLQGLKTPVSEGDTLLIIPSIAGG